MYYEKIHTFCVNVLINVNVFQYSEKNPQNAANHWNKWEYSHIVMNVGWSDKYTTYLCQVSLIHFNEDTYRVNWRITKL